MDSTIARMTDIRDGLVENCGQEVLKQAVLRFKPQFDRVMKANQCDEMTALKELLENIQPGPDKDGMSHLLISVACELTEPKYS